MADAKDRALVWMLQRLSHLIGLRTLAAQLVEMFPDNRNDSPDDLAEWLTEVCLDPEEPLSGLGIWRRRLQEFEALWVESHVPPVTTYLGTMIDTALDYTLEVCGLTVIEGQARTGKTFALEHWAAQRLGRVRLIQVPATNDDLSFYIAIAKGLGLTVESGAKAKKLIPRIEATLHGSGLMVCLDEAHYLWSAHAYRHTRPSRICWLINSLVNHHVPVALVCTSEFFRSLRACEKEAGWSSAQLVGRIGEYVKLPGEISMTDLRAVARALLPGGDAKSIEALALYADGSAK